jgi:putative ABC transport system substrate-binding protein
MPVVGFLGSDTPELYAERVSAFRRGLNELGFVEGHNVAIEYRFARDYDAFPALVTDLVRRGAAVILAPTNPATLAARAATTTIPIVFITGSDPVTAGFVGSMNRPGGNATGVATLGTDLGEKRLELLREAVPAAKLIGVLVNPANSTLAESQLRNLQAAARILGLQLHVVHASAEPQIDTAFATLQQLQAGGLVITTDSFIVSYMGKLAALSVRYALPAIYQYREFAAAGGLMSYGPSILEFFRLTGIYAGRILKGDKPADLPVQQATRIGLTINMKAAKALGLTFPLTLLGRADEVIE